MFMTLEEKQDMEARVRTEQEREYQETLEYNTKYPLRSKMSFPEKTYQDMMFWLYIIEHDEQVSQEEYDNLMEIKQAIQDLEGHTLVV